LYLEKHLYFQDQEHLLGDAAYKSSPTLMTGYSRMQHRIANAERFNVLLNKNRTKIEHAFGMLKGWFPSLTRLRLQLRTRKDVDTITDHIMACVVLYNILTGLDKDDDELMDNDAQQRLRKMDENVKRTVGRTRGVIEQLPEPEDEQEHVDFNDWRAAARYDAAMKARGDIKRAQ
ncbi:hypothetical protein BGZ51_000613, partial [Haplosporangium sp. Z 767]